MTDSSQKPNTHFYQIRDRQGRWTQPGPVSPGVDHEGAARAAVRTPVGWLCVEAQPEGLCALTIVDTAENVEAEGAGAAARVARHAAETLAIALESGSRPPPVPLVLRGTPFQLSVWRALCDLDQATISYGALARRLGRPDAARAVASACAANRIAVLVPCHRVVGADGALAGYRWGSERKRWLLAAGI